MSESTAVPLLDDRQRPRAEGKVYYSIDSYPDKTTLSEHEIHCMIRTAFDKWQRISNFEFVYTPPGGGYQSLVDIRFRFEEAGGKFPTERLAVCEANSRTGKKVIKFDDDVTWIDQAAEGDRQGAISPDPLFPVIFKWLVGVFDGRSDLLTVACHEIGHALGLQHNEDSASIMNKALTSKESTAWMSGRELGIVDAISLGKIYKKDFVLRDLKGVDYFHWVGGMVTETDITSRTLEQIDQNYSWGAQTLWKVLLFQGYGYNTNFKGKGYRRIYGFLEPQNSKNLTPDTIVACGGWTNGGDQQRSSEWGLTNPPTGGVRPFGSVLLYRNPGGDRDGQFIIATSRLRDLEGDPRYPPEPAAWRILGGYTDVRNATSSRSSSVIERKWGQTDGGYTAQIAEGRTHKGGKAYANAYARAYLVYGNR